MTLLLTTRQTGMAGNLSFINCLAKFSTARVHFQQSTADEIRLIVNLAQEARYRIYTSYAIRFLLVARFIGHLKEYHESDWLIHF